MIRDYGWIVFAVFVGAVQDWFFPGTLPFYIGLLALVRTVQIERMIPRGLK